MQLLIDAGNTRIKWAVLDRDTWLGHDALPLGRADQLPRSVAEHLAGMAVDMGEIRRIWVSNVAGEKAAQPIREIQAGQPGRLHFIAARERQCGVHNGYTDPGQLGSDRWAALIAAWDIARGACLVVDCGTAITIDALSAQGEFRGGLILPGPDLMQRSLVGATGQLGAAQGKYAAFPQNTADALYSGAVQACCGAIERQYALLGHSGAPVVLSGGAAGKLQDHIGLPLHTVDNLVLWGLMLIARETGET
jgi:type III pantothenate kinase